MTKRIRSVDMVFNHIKFANDILARRAELQISGSDVMRLVSDKVDKTQIYRYERGEEKNMKMQNFLAICNLYDLDPRDYFELEM